MNTYSYLSKESKLEIVNFYISEYQSNVNSFETLKLNINETSPMHGKDIDGTIFVYQKMVNELQKHKETIQ